LALPVNRALIFSIRFSTTDEHGLTRIKLLAGKTYLRLGGKLLPF
jgi:hypothetical protein